MNLIRKESDWLSSYKARITSQNGEDGIIEEIFKIIKEDNKWCVEFGAYDGRNLSNVWNLIINKNWSGFLIEANKRNYKKLLETYKNNKRAICINKLVNFDGTNTLDNILAKTPLPKSFDLLCIDIDGNDYHVWESIKLYEPRVVIIEFNPSMSADVEFIQLRDMKINHGSSLLSLTKLGKQKGYELIAATDCNAFFVKKNYFALFEIKDNSPNFIYKERKAETRLLQLYDGSVVLYGFKHLLWHGIEINEKRIQVLPKFFTGYPPRLKFLLYLALSGRWKLLFNNFIKGKINWPFKQ